MTLAIVSKVYTEETKLTLNVVVSDLEDYRFNLIVFKRRKKSHIFLMQGVEIFKSSKAFVPIIFVPIFILNERVYYRILPC